MNVFQYAIARAARQATDRINADEQLDDAQRSNAVATFDALNAYLGTLTESEYAAVLPALREVGKAVRVVERWQ